MSNQDIINEMAVGLGGIGGGPMGEDDLDLGPPGLDDEAGGPMDDPMHDDMDDLEDDLDGEDSECVKCDRGELRQLLDQVEMGEMSAEEAFKQLSSGGDDELGLPGDESEPMGDAMGGMGEMGGPGAGNGMDLGGLGLEGIRHIANMLTDDPDIFSEGQMEGPMGSYETAKGTGGFQTNVKCGECGKAYQKGKAACPGCGAGNRRPGETGLGRHGQ